MTRDELLQRLQEIEWEDFECKQAKSELPKSVWETISAFSNTSGGWIVLGVREEKVGKSRTFVIEGVGNAEKLEQDLIGTLRSKSKFNVTISVRSQKYDFDGKTVLAFFIPSSTVKPVYYNNNLGNTFIRTPTMPKSQLFSAIKHLAVGLSWKLTTQVSTTSTLNRCKRFAVAFSSTTKHYHTTNLAMKSFAEKSASHCMAK